VVSTLAGLQELNNRIDYESIRLLTIDEPVSGEIEAE